MKVAAPDLVEALLDALQAGHRELAPTLQQGPSAQIPQVQAPSAGDLHPRAPGSATRTSYTGRATVGATTNHELTLKSDHPSGPGHNRNRNPQTIPAPRQERQY